MRRTIKAMDGATMARKHRTADRRSVRRLVLRISPKPPMNSTTQPIYVKGSLTPSQRDTILAATKWIERICDRKEMLPASFMDNTDPAPIAKKLRAILDSQNAELTHPEPKP
jgi:hypothetical protein